jgi:hypothetical protein
VLSLTRERVLPACVNLRKTLCDFLDHVVANYYYLYTPVLDRSEVILIPHLNFANSNAVTFRQKSVITLIVKGPVRFGNPPNIPLK